MQLNPYLTFNGQCETAFKFYERSLGGKIEAIDPFTANRNEQVTGRQRPTVGGGTGEPHTGRGSGP